MNSSSLPKVTCLIGTRPEAIKMAPVILAVRQCGKVHCEVLLSGQHQAMAAEALGLFGIHDVVWLETDLASFSLADQAAAYLEGLGRYLSHTSCAYMLVHGDTTTGLIGALAAFYAHVPVGHVEAGLRSGDMQNPFPEEANRVLIDRLCDHLFAPTEGAAANLRQEGCATERIEVTGNTVVDAVRLIAARAPRACALSDLSRLPMTDSTELVLLTAHRRENWGTPLRDICGAARDLIRARENLWVVMPVHPNPAVKLIVFEELGDVEQVILTDPLDYDSLIALERDADLILTDSGGIQEEAPEFGTPVLVLRETTERPEAVLAGFAQVIGRKPEDIVSAAVKALDAGRLTGGTNPFGDGKAAERICARVLHALKIT
ncbi:non-hydrolyzing UDP-N-acetylglucosamine 2-epimerase [Pseudovibrio exalbescens]|uniref:non-hydrolyzing UDP-N-acetylglucosamine 2-epimerase n=1 Tax=Pseudovibrio exalbescens TaxID=197461 RepID=UPI000C99B035|nr:UDP-N-acetylglucosamine 2-epimerase (non-hydrolyzing) [Pseudovibrio exalbescens]